MNLGREGTALAARDLRVSYGEREVLRGVSFEMRRGERLAVLGPNGCGKTTLLRALAGVLPARSGEIRLLGRPLAGLPRRTVAQTLAVLPQDTEIISGLTALELVLLGRTPRLGTFRAEQHEDYAIAFDALERCGCRDLAERPLDELSGGERQRVYLALALAQEPHVLLLDEPTTHLDILHQHQVLSLLGELHQRQDLTSLTVLHDLNLAALFFDRLILLADGRVLGDGPPEQVITPQTIRAAYGLDVHVQPHPENGRPQVLFGAPHGGSNQ